MEQQASGGSPKKQPTRAIVLLSGGLDSGTALYLAAYHHGPENVSALSVDYRQRHVKEIECAKKLCSLLGIPHQTLQGPQWLQSMLNDPGQEIPNVSYDELEGVSPTYVPFRNGLMLSMMAAAATMMHAHLIYFGAHAEDALNWAYPDCTPEFTGAMANAIYVGTYHQTRLVVPWQYFMKHEIVQVGHRLKVPFHYTWSCYKGEELHCGTCPTCRSRQEAFFKAGVIDPTEYAERLKQ